jgi:PAS domain-containing protein
MRWNIAPWHGSNGEVQGLLLITEDITLVKEKEKERDQDAEILAKANEISRIGTWMRNFTNNTAFWSRISKEILEVPMDLEPELNLVMNFYKPGTSRDLANSVLDSALRTGKPFDIQVEMLTGRGNVKKVRIIGYPDFRNGRCERISGTFQEISS